MPHPAASATNATLDLKIAELALHLLFLGQIYAVINPARADMGDTAAGIGEWTTSIAACILIASGAMRTVNLWPRLGDGLRLWTLIGVGIVGIMTLMGFAKGMDDPLYTVLQSLPWLGTVFLPALGVPQISPGLLRAFRWHAFLGVIGVTLVLALNWGTIAAEQVNRADTLEVKPAQFLLYSVFFQLFRLPLETNLHRGVALMGIVQMLLIAVVSGTRQGIFLIAGVLLITTWIVYRVRLPGRDTQFLARLLVMGMVLGSLLVGGWFIKSKLSGGMELLTTRMTAQTGRGSFAENSRLLEAQLLFQQFGPVDYMIGRGVRGQFDNWAAPKQDNVHIGWLRTLLKGGLPIVLLLLVGYVLTSARCLLYSRDAATLAAAGLGAFFAFKNSTGNIILAFGGYYIIAIACGSAAYACWSRRYNNQSARPPLPMPPGPGPRRRLRREPVSAQNEREA